MDLDSQPPNDRVAGPRVMQDSAQRQERGTFAVFHLAPQPVPLPVQQKPGYETSSHVSEGEAHSDAERPVARFRVVEVDPVVGRFCRAADAATDRKVSVHAADEAVVALLTIRAALAIEASAGK